MSQTDYLDLELSIGAGSATPDGAARYPIAVLRSPAGEAQGAMDWPWSPGQLALLLDELHSAVLGAPARPTEALMRRAGEQLFSALFGGDIGYCYDASRATARPQGAGLRLKLRIEAPDLLAAPWELLYDPRAAEFLCLARQTPVVRYLAIPQPVQPLAVEPPLRILGMAASPDGAPPIDAAQEQARLGEALSPLQRQGLLELRWLGGQRWRDLQTAMQQGPWHIFHFAGHAFYDSQHGEGQLLLAGDQGEMQLLRAVELARLLDEQPALRLAVLNACEGARGDEQRAYSSLATALVRRGLPAVVAMQYPIPDAAAVDFSQSFYAALAAGLPVDAATTAARKAMSLSAASPAAWLTPVLYMRAPDGRLWQPALRSAPPEARTSQAFSPARSEPQVNANIQIGGSATGSNIVVGGTLNMAQGGAGGSEPTTADRAAIEQQIGQLLFAVRTLRGHMDAARIQTAEIQLRLIQGELTKGAGQSPDAATVIGAGDWLLANAPDLAEPLARFFTMPAVRRQLTRAGAEAARWEQRLFRG